MTQRAMISTGVSWSATSDSSSGTMQLLCAACAIVRFAASVAAGVTVQKTQCAANATDVSWNGKRYIGSGDGAGHLLHVFVRELYCCQGKAAAVGCYSNGVVSSAVAGAVLCGVCVGRLHAAWFLLAE